MHANHHLRHYGPWAVIAVSGMASLNACATLGSLMSPYSEHFSCKNSDHGQCIHPADAYADAVAGRAPRSDPAVTRDARRLAAASLPKAGGHHHGDTPAPAAQTAYAGYRDSVYRELQGLIDAPVTPMLKPQHSIRTLILPYTDRTHPTRLYMPRYIFSVLDATEWTVGTYLIDPPSAASQAPVLAQVREPSADASADTTTVMGTPRPTIQAVRP